MTKTHLRCINLDRRTDRWRSFQKNLACTTLKTLPLGRFRAIDGRRLPEEIVERGLENDKIIGLLRGRSYPGARLGASYRIISCGRRSPRTAPSARTTSS